MKARNLIQSSLRNDPINHRMHGFSFCIFEDKIEVQDVISPLSLDQIKLEIKILSAPPMRKCIKNEIKSNGTRIWCLDSSNFLKIQGQSFPSRRTRYFKEKFGRDRPMKGRLAIDGRDHASFDRNGAIKLHPFDQRWSVRICPHRVKEEVCCLDFPSDLHRAVTINRKVHRSRLIVTVITPLIEGED